MGTKVLEVKIGNKGFRGENLEQTLSRAELGTKVLEVRCGIKRLWSQNWEHGGLKRSELGSTVLEVRFGNKNYKVKIENNCFRGQSWKRAL